MQVRSTTFLPILARLVDDLDDPAAPVFDEFMGELGVAYSFGPPYGERMVARRDLERLALSRRQLRRYAADNLDTMAETVRVHGQPPAFMLSFDGLESSLLLAAQFWDGLTDVVPGRLIVGVPARDVVIVTGSESRRGLEKARRAVDRVFFAGGPHPLTRHLLIRERGKWDVFRTGAVPRQPTAAP